MISSLSVNHWRKQCFRLVRAQQAEPNIEKAASNGGQPPYQGTIWIDPDIITADDPSTLESLTYAGRGNHAVYDRRVLGWITINAYLFDVVWDDGIQSQAQINPEFGSINAATIEAEKYGRAICSYFELASIS